MSYYRDNIIRLAPLKEKLIAMPKEKRYWRYVSTILDIDVKDWNSLCAMIDIEKKQKEIKSRYAQQLPCF